jgi:8-oxo-dGTP pyrophosphatase MutT (NUDIX family)
MQTFGTPVFTRTNRGEGSYALVFSTEGRLLTVRGRRGLFPSRVAGWMKGELPEQALHRELLEECGLEDHRAGMARRGSAALCGRRPGYRDARAVLARARAGQVLGPGEDDWAWLRAGRDPGKVLSRLPWVGGRVGGALRVAGLTGDSRLEQ